MRFSFNPDAFRQLSIDVNRQVLRSLNESSAKVVEEVDNNFRSKSFFGERWVNNSTNTPILVSTGQLRASIRELTRTTKMVRVGTTLEYADIHNYGGTLQASVRQEKFFWHMYKRYRKEIYKNSAIKVKKGESIIIPQRQFIGEHQQMTLYIQRIINRNLSGNRY